MARYAYLDLAREHLTRSEWSALLAVRDLTIEQQMLSPIDDDYPLPRVIPHANGMFIVVPDHDQEETDDLRARYPHLAALLAHARAHDCHLIKLDRDGEKDSALPTFTWNSGGSVSSLGT